MIYRDSYTSSTKPHCLGGGKKAVSLGRSAKLVAKLLPKLHVVPLIESAYSSGSVCVWRCKLPQEAVARAAVQLAQSCLGGTWGNLLFTNKVLCARAGVV